MAPLVERRLAAILAADVVGYSRLIEADEAGTLKALRAMRQEVLKPLLSEHHGRVVKLMGDGVLVEFGSVVSAIACAATLQARIAAAYGKVAPERRIVLRIGVHLGDVVVEGEDLLGDGVQASDLLGGPAIMGSTPESSSDAFARRRWHHCATIRSCKSLSGSPWI